MGDRVNYRRTPQAREQRSRSPFEMFVPVMTYAQRLQRAAETLIDYFTPKSAEEIKDGSRLRRRGHWMGRRQATGAEAKRIHVRRIQKAARRTRARHHAKSGRRV